MHRIDPVNWELATALLVDFCLTKLRWIMVPPYATVLVFLGVGSQNITLKKFSNKVDFLVVAHSVDAFLGRGPDGIG